MCTSSTKGRLPSSRRRDDVQCAARLQAEPILRDRRALVKQAEQIKLQFLKLVVGDLTGQVLSKDAALTVDDVPQRDLSHFPTQPPSGPTGARKLRLTTRISRTTLTLTSTMTIPAHGVTLMEIGAAPKPFARRAEPPLAADGRHSH